MKEIKYRYIWQQEETGRIMEKHFTLTEIENGAVKQFPRYCLIARNQYTNVKNLDGYDKEIED